MLFSSMIFLWAFLPIVLIVYFISPKKLKNIILLLASLFFYAWGEPKYIILMISSIFLNYILGILIDKFKKRKKLLVIISIILNIGLLAYFKYLNFGVEIINSFFKGAITDFKAIALPIGISFYTFQILSYIIDLYRRRN